MTGRHPDFEDLCRWVEDDLSPDRRARLSEHVAECPDCQETVRTLRAMGEAASRLTASELPGDLWEEIVERRERGDRVLLPTEPPAESESSGLLGDILLPRWIAGLAAILVVGAAGLWITRSEPAAAGGSVLRFQPAAPERGATVTAVYRPGTVLGGRADTLRLRARFRTAADQWYNRGAIQSTVGVLTVGEGGRYRGTIELPDSVVYASFAVENVKGSRVDANQGRLWELLVRDSMGNPLLAALEQQIADLVGRNWSRAREASRRATRLYPNCPSVWQSYALFQRRANAERLTDSLKSFHRKKFERFHRRLMGRDSLPASRVNAMLSYAFVVEDSARGSYWQKRLEREYPRHPWILFGRADVANREERPAAYLKRLEQFWSVLLETETGTQRQKRSSQGSFITNGLTYSQRADAPNAYLRWVQRYRQYGRVTPASVAHNAPWMLDHPEIRPQGIAWLRTWVGRLDPVPDAYRKLRNTRDRQRLEFRDQGQEFLALLGEGLLAEGDTAAALDTLDLAARRGWNPRAFRTLARVRRSLGDTAEALTAYARIAVDPSAPRAGLGDGPPTSRREGAEGRARPDRPGPGSLPDSVRSWIGSVTDSAAWERALEQARREMVRETMAAAEYARLPRPIHLQSLSGETRRLGEMSDGRVTVVVFWDNDSAYPPELQRLDRLIEVLSQRGVRAVTIAESGPVSELRRYVADHDLDFPVYLDPDGEATDAFSQTSVTDYYLLDPSGRIVFGKNQLSLDEIHRSAVALLLDTRSPRAGGS